jgi:hypothetical protein
MNLRHTLLFSLLAVAGGVLGSWLFRPIPAQAQQNVRNENQIFVPTEGLRFVTDQQRTVAVMGHQGGNAILVLYDANGRPSVGLTAGTGGSVTVRAQADGGSVEVSSLDGTSTARLAANASSANLEATFRTSVFSVSNNGANTNVNIPGPNNMTAVQLLTGQNGGQMTLYGPASRSAMTAEGTPTGGMLTLRDGTGKTTATVSNAGTFASLKEGRVVWQAPPVVGN